MAITRLFPGVVTLSVLAGCATFSQREASCRCFTTDGETSGLCDFEALGPDPHNYVVTRAAHDADGLNVTASSSAVAEDGESCDE